MIQLALDGYAARMEKMNRLAKWMAWHIGVFGRAERLPTFDEMMGQPTEAQDADEIAETMDRWMVQHNARLGADETHYVVAELVEDS